MEDSDLFTNTLNEYVKGAPVYPNPLNYHCGQKLLAEKYLSAQKDLECAFHLSESISAFVRTMAVYREEQVELAADRQHKITSYVKPVKDLIANVSEPNTEGTLLDTLAEELDEVADVLKPFEVEKQLPLYKTYMRFSSENNVDNFQKILRELPKEWTIIQITAPYNPNENLKLFNEYKQEMPSIYLSLFTNDYLDDCGLDPVTLNIPANVHKEGEKPLFEELYSLLDENYSIIDNAHLLNNKRLLKKYWERRDEVDLRLKSVVNVMDKEWLGGYGSLLTGKLVDTSLKEKVKKVVNDTIKDWGFFKLTQRQIFLLYNLIESSPVLSGQQVRFTIRSILTEHGNTDDVREAFGDGCQNCNKNFISLNELCFECLSKCFAKIHHFSVADGIKAFSQAATLVKDNESWDLKKAKRHPVVLLVDELLDTFPWETLPILNHHPVCRMENIHFLYYLYKVHEDNVIDGYFNAQTKTGRYVINPEKNLDRMEKRMSSFVKYWCDGWEGYIGETPTPAAFLQYIVESDIFLYCGHGDGCRLAAGGGGGAGVEEARGTRCAALLAGCGSVRLTHPPRRAPPAASHHHLHIACSPMVVGMLWEVTDLEVDKMVTSLVSLVVPSKAPSWQHVGKTNWSQGILETNVEQTSEVPPERDLLRAVSRSRRSSSYAMIGSSMVARGLPLRVTPD